MGSTVPWWGAGVFTLAGAALAFLGAQWQSWRTERSQRRRLSREDKVAAYLQLIEIGRKLAATPVWPNNTSADLETPEDQYDSLIGLAEQVAFYGPPRVNAAVEALLTVAEQHRDAIITIRTDSRPAHGSGIDLRLRPVYQQSVATLHGAIDDFVRTCRKDLEIEGRYHALSNHQHRGTSPNDRDRSTDT
ncbi:hypothetical protein JK358_30305 [Nocardia sp. 2]|uniref:Secreted protein n=1 Tax=Nocardia acididurans TaxID=2802282 RepID=A0ABS1MDH4_9NOCA|nr:hypothetical protein [Nocardia acididurans]MBL1078703.1 hypothetical protein [Nocardia acididurans]